MSHLNFVFLFFIIFLFSCNSDTDGLDGLGSDWTRFQYDQQNIGISDATPTRKNPEEIWRIETGSAIGTSPITYKGKVYFGNQDGEFYCVDALSGEEIWQVQTNGGIFSQPAIYNDVLYFGDDDWGFFALKPESGESIWAVSLQGDISACPLFYNEKVIIQDESGILYALNGSNGELSWYQDYCFLDGSSALQDGTIYILSCEYEMPNMDNSLVAINADNGEIEWKLDYEGPNIYSSPTIKDDILIFGTSGHIYCVDIPTKSFKWDYKVDDSYEFGNSANITEDKVIFGCYGNSSSYLAALNIENGEYIWGSRYDDHRFQIRSSAAIGSNNTIIGSVGQFGLIAYDLIDGSILWNYKLGGGGSEVSPIINGDYIFWGASNGIFVAMK